MPEDKANRVYYGQLLTMRDILFEHKVQQTESTFNLAQKLNNYSAVPKDARGFSNNEKSEKPEMNYEGK